MDKPSDAPMQMAPGHATGGAEIRLPSYDERTAEHPAVDDYLDEPEITRWERIDPGVGQRGVRQRHLPA